MSHSHNSISLYIKSTKEGLERANAYRSMITALSLRMIDVTEGQASIVDEYWMNDGQMSVKTSYRSVEDVVNGIRALERLYQMEINNLNGRVFTLRPGKNFY